MINPANLAPQNKMLKATCPDCAAELSVPLDVEKGEILSCPGCGLELEVKNLTVGGGCLELQEISIEGEDWGE
jgi:alpha-aminoadipate/glutamate carrier protein LysW